MAQAGSNRRLSGGEIALIVVVSALVLIFAVMLVMRLTDDADGEAGGPTTAATTTETSEAPQEEPTAEETGEDLSSLNYSFASPSGNIACAMSPDRVVCGIGTFNYEVPSDVAEGCEGNAGHFLAVTSEGSSLLCDTSAPEPTFDLEGVEALEYGQELERGAFTCVSERDGVTCTHPESGHSISMARATYELG